MHVSIFKIPTCYSLTSIEEEEKGKSILPAGIKNLSRRYCHSGIDHILGSRKIGNVCACAVTCLDSRQRDGGELSRLLSVHGKHGQCLFVCRWDLSVCSGGSSPPKFRNVSG